ncbi:unnamed protein product [Rotaria sp. Silwood1]|nr:unnamed protein product [Rotaria sp. Silwood1]CAF3554398.1 unnamed protein product [Rotaria sp. Silwood1]CAF4570827.1 unnamed protein product [Rotaria sp. Silwood1]CAF4903651.1 unnamed protein product [Rotaria sp. Silwood1]CAF5021475.1 unnamed protein product [Rotaria sp. Silwood1]
MCRTCLPHLVTTKGNIINTASIAALHDHPLISIYGGITSGGIDTPMNKNVRLPLDINNHLFDNLKMPSRQFGKTEDVTSVIAMLASQDGCFINGDVIDVLLF